MNRQVLELARWELVRYFKLRDVILSVVLVIGISGASWALSWWQARSSESARVAVISELAIPAPPAALELTRHGRAELPALRDRLHAGELDGVLLVAPDEVRLIASARPHWLDAARELASAALREHRITALGVTSEALAAALAPAELELELTDGASAGRPAMHAALLSIGVMLAGLFFGLTYLFMSVTGEKQQRVSEQMFVMTSAQTMIDGKLLGLGALSVLVTAQMVVVAAVTYEVFVGGAGDWLATTLASVAPGTLLALAAYAILGFAFWLAVTGAWFATIQDPMSSARSQALLLPFLPLSAAFIGLSDPDSVMMLVLGQLPFTSMSVMPARLVLGDVSVVEVLVSLSLLAAATVLARGAAARIYEAGMLMYGKEPSVGEMARWLRRPPA